MCRDTLSFFSPKKRVKEQKHFVTGLLSEQDCSSWPTKEVCLYGQQGVGWTMLDRDWLAGVGRAVWRGWDYLLPCLSGFIAFIFTEPRKML